LAVISPDVFESSLHPYLGIVNTSTMKMNIKFFVMSHNNI
jgi:hypothetical protein